MSVKQLLDNNRDWAQSTAIQNPDLFPALAQGQKPKYLWLGCSDSRVPANQILGLQPGELFTHRNIANQVQVDDVNCMSVLQYAVDVLQVEHVIVCGHYSCGGVQMAMNNAGQGNCGQWLAALTIDCNDCEEVLAELNEVQSWQRMCEINVQNQVHNLSQTTTVQQAWERGQSLQIHGWIYSLEDGLIRDLDLSQG